MNHTEIIDIFKRTGALLEGHFELSSGLHSAKYLQCARVLQHPKEAEQFGKAIIEKLKAENFDVKDFTLVAAPAIGGIIIGHETARALGVRFLWTERENGVMSLRRGFTVSDTDKILVVEDVITTGGSTRETIEALIKHGARVTAAASIIDRSNGTADVGVARFALAALDVPTYSPDACPLCARGETAIKPGSRKVSLDLT